VYKTEYPHPQNADSLSLKELLQLDDYVLDIRLRGGGEGNAAYPDTRFGAFKKLPPKEQRIPVVLTGEEVERLIKATANIKHRAILMLAYSLTILGHTGPEYSVIRNVCCFPEYRRPQNSA